MATLAETPSRIKPCLLEAVPVGLADLIANLTTAAERLGGRLHPQTAASLADLVRVMNCYYSNLIEGHHTMPRDIERALADDLDGEEPRRNLQIEARAHIRVQRMIDRLYTEGALPEPASVDFIRWLHREFYADAPEAMLQVEGRGNRLRIEPGVFRTSNGQNVIVGRHVPPDSERVETFMRHFEQRYRLAQLGKGGRIIAIAAAHHRLN